MKLATRFCGSVLWNKNQISLCQICANRKHAFLHRSAKGYIYLHGKYLCLLLFLLGIRMSGDGTPFPNEGSNSLLYLLLFTVTCLMGAFVLCLFCAKKHIRDGRIVHHRMGIEFHNCPNVFSATANS